MPGFPINSNKFQKFVNMEEIGMLKNGWFAKTFSDKNQFLVVL